ncbi:hypothetical protein NQ315_017396 [Exocentrus adspersus]|uniref:Uncharacterized protein n=1 Tax=Exocentrus adspersus TaxID=1586481 RepID=A0AAV8VKK6_9CUCU|nr:hypothetical protein NQ315_017396 [Exocentrus adspersus]
MHRIGLAEDAEYRLCMEDDETAEHVLCTCPAADRTRFSIEILKFYPRNRSNGFLLDAPDDLLIASENCYNFRNSWLLSV